jgi:hypothetical protein
MTLPGKTSEAPWWYKAMHLVPFLGFGMSIGEAINACF